MVILVGCFIVIGNDKWLQLQLHVHHIDGIIAEIRSPLRLAMLWFVLIADLARPFLNHINVFNFGDTRLRLDESDTLHAPSQFMVSMEGARRDLTSVRRSKSTPTTMRCVRRASALSSTFAGCTTVFPESEGGTQNL